MEILGKFLQVTKKEVQVPAIEEDPEHQQVLKELTLLLEERMYNAPEVHSGGYSVAHFTGLPCWMDQKAIEDRYAALSLIQCVNETCYDPGIGSSVQTIHVITLGHGSVINLSGKGINLEIINVTAQSDARYESKENRAFNGPFSIQYRCVDIDLLGTSVIHDVNLFSSPEYKLGEKVLNLTEIKTFIERVKTWETVDPRNSLHRDFKGKL